MSNARNISQRIIATPAQFDASTGIINGEFLQRALGSNAGQINIATPSAIPISYAGKRIVIGAAGDYPLPLRSSVPTGSKFYVVADAAALTVSSVVSDTIKPFSGSLLTSISIPQYSTAVFTAGLSSTSWIFEEGSSSLKYCAEFGATLASNGYQKLPSGLIIQWGAIGTSGSADIVVTFPIAFPTGVKSIVSAAANYSAASSTQSFVSSTADINATSFKLATYTSNTAARAAITTAWVATGF